MEPWLPNDVARCPGHKAGEEWEKPCADCLRRTAIPTRDGWHVQMRAPPPVNGECDMRIRP